ncbi:MAG: hypothetical protein IKN27_14585 [Selenomonadaceae bacterium]|nr:hypothetical protein [Selenomonadaceae bacterium]
MKKFFLALTILLCFAGKSFAAEFTDEQINFWIRETASAAAKISAPLNFGMVNFLPNFNTTVEPIYRRYFPKSDNPEEFYDYMITNYTTLDGEFDGVIKNVFNNNRVAIFAVTTGGKRQFKILRCCWTEPTTDAEKNFVTAIRTAFVQSAAQSYFDNVTQGRVEFSLATVENICVLTVMK